VKMAVALLDKLPVCTESGYSFTPQQELTAGSCTESHGSSPKRYAAVGLDEME